MNLHFLHGFFGLPIDWMFLKTFFPQDNLYFHHIDSFLPTVNETHDKRKSQFNVWAEKFNQHVLNLNNSSHSKQNNILIGYSLGGRLALHALIQQNKSKSTNHQSIWDGAIIFSANPGLSSQSEKQERLFQDKQWAHKILTKPWLNIQSEWNAQGVFTNQKDTFYRDEVNYNKSMLAQILINFSLGKQKNLRSQMLKLNLPVLWITGENDIKFTKISKELMHSHQNFKYEIVQNAGHRVPWEQPQKTIELIAKFTSSLSTHLQ